MTSTLTIVRLKKTHRSSELGHIQPRELDNKDQVWEVPIGYFQLYGNPAGAVHVEVREKLSSSIA